jgi:hypothetical protein
MCVHTLCTHPPTPRLQDEVVAQLKSTIDGFREALPVFDEVANPAMRLRHWAALFELLGRELELNELGQPRDFTVRMLMYDHNVAEKLEQVGGQGHASSVARAAGVDCMHCVWYSFEAAAGLPSIVRTLPL